jgi:hypothetical protein
MLTAASSTCTKAANLYDSPQVIDSLPDFLQVLEAWCDSPCTGVLYVHSLSGDYDEYQVSTTFIITSPGNITIIGEYSAGDEPPTIAAQDELGTLFLVQTGFLSLKNVVISVSIWLIIMIDLQTTLSYK